MSATVWRDVDDKYRRRFMVSATFRQVERAVNRIATVIRWTGSEILTADPTQQESFIQYELFKSINLAIYKAPPTTCLYESRDTWTWTPYSQRPIRLNSTQSASWVELYTRPTIVQCVGRCEHCYNSTQLSFDETWAVSRSGWVLNILRISVCWLNMNRD